MAADPESPLSSPPSSTPSAGSLLPVVWRSPWRRLLDDLGRDLPALAAFLGLRLRELLRRNFSGELSVPAFWPRGLIVWFWPLLLLLIVGVLLLPPVLLLRHGSAPAEPPPAPLELPLDPLPAPGSVPPALPEPVVPGPTAPAIPPPLDPLLQLFTAAADADLLRTARPQPLQGRLQLQVQPRFLELPADERQRRADGWLQQTRAMGYDRLELLGPQSDTVGRSALVGDGMILLTPTAP